MGRLSNIAGLFGDVKTRTIVIFTVVILVVGIGIGLTSLKDSAVVGDARTAAVPRGIQNVPGVGGATPQYTALQLEANRRQLEEARTTGTSAIPTLTGGFTAVETEEETAPQQTTGTGGELSVAERIRLQQERTQQRIALQKAQQDAQNLMQRQQQFEAETREGLNKAMAQQAKALMNSWTKTTAQEYVIGNAKKLEKDKDGNGDGRSAGSRFGRGGAAGGGRGSERGEVIARAGDMTFAVLSTDVDSDDKGPILATIVSGKLKGSMILGSYETTQNGQRVIMKFNKLSLPKTDKSISIDAVAVNPFNGRTGLATSVDNHVLRRYGSMFASSLLKGYGEAIKDQGNSIATTASGTTIESTPERSNSDKLLIAFSEFGTALGSKTDKIFDTPPTVRVKEGVGLGVLFLSDVSSQGIG